MITVIDVTTIMHNFRSLYILYPFMPSLMTMPLTPIVLRHTLAEFVSNDLEMNCKNRDI